VYQIVVADPVKRQLLQKKCHLGSKELVKLMILEIMVAILEFTEEEEANMEVVAEEIRIGVFKEQGGKNNKTIF
jgi:hypothetical protein